MNETKNNTFDDWPLGVDRVLLDTVDSTNAEAARRGPMLQNPTWILAKRQTSARGRRGRAWSSPEGNFAATFVLKPDMPAQKAALMSFVAACATRQALVDVGADADALRLKWPNDVLYHGRKIAGILLEASGTGARLDWLAIGIGVNLVAAPPQETLEARARDATSLLDETGKAVDVELFLSRLAAPMQTFAAHLSKDFEPIRQHWLAHAYGQGSAITARLAREELIGIFETVDMSGALILSTANGRREIQAADIYMD